MSEIPKPDWTSTDGSIALYCSDCLDILPMLPKGSVDAVVTDPPFGIGFKYDGHDDTPDGYQDFIWSRIEAAEAACSPGSPVFVWQAMPNARHFAEWFPREWRIFAACKNFVQIRPTPIQFSFDPVLFWWTDGRRWNGGAGRDWLVADTSPGFREPVSGHPCPRPLQHVGYIVGATVAPRGVVIDPFMGSGTTGVACVRLGRRFIGIEKEPKYFDIAVRRIQEAIDDGGLYRAAETKQEQLTLGDEANTKEAV